MSEETAIVRLPEQVQLGELRLTPENVIQRATELAKPLRKMIVDRGLVSSIQGRDYVQVEGWNTLGAMLGIAPRTVFVHEVAPDIFEATVELVRVSDGMVIGRGIGECGSPDELNRKGMPVWGDRPRFAKKSMAQTRATGKAYRQALSWIMKLAGYEPTPAEEMIEAEFAPSDLPATAQHAPQAAQKTPGTTKPASGRKQPPKSQNKPLEPSAIKAFVEKIIQNDVGGDDGIEQLGPIMALLGNILSAAGGDPVEAADAVFQYLFEIPVDEATYAHVNALWRWLGIEVSEGGVLTIGRPTAAEEAGTICRAAQE